jgi:hypothetical protein
MNEWNLKKKHVHVVATWGKPIPLVAIRAKAENARATSSSILASFSGPV